MNLFNSLYLSYAVEENSLNLIVSIDFVLILSNEIHFGGLDSSRRYFAKSIGFSLAMWLFFMSFRLEILWPEMSKLRKRLVVGVSCQKKTSDLF